MNIKQVKRNHHIKELYTRSGLTLREIAKIFGITPEGVRHIVNNPNSDKIENGETLDKKE
jgi:transposase